MTTFTALFLTFIALPAGPDAPVLLEFSSPSCGPCQQMKPVIEQLQRKGYPIKAVEIEDVPDLAARYQVREVPTFLVVNRVDGRAIARTKGLQSPAELARFYNQAVNQSPPPPRAHVEPDPDEVAAAEAKAKAQVVDGRDDSPETPRQPSGAPNPKPWETVVRIKVHGQGSIGFGSGTIISSTPDEAIILTCAHIFKMERGPQYPPSRFPQKITIDLFDGKLSGRQPAQQVHYANETYEGRAIDYDFNRDVGLIRIRPGRRLPCARVVPKHWTPAAGMDMITVGCSEGRDATAWNTKITNASQRFSGAYQALECSTAPKQGRSGGGLFTSDGHVAGVCDFAEPMGNHGLYAAPNSIYAILDRNKLMALYAPAAPRNGPMLAKADVTPPQGPGTFARGQSPDRDESGDVTIPPPEMLGIKWPTRVEKVAASSTKRKGWQTHSAQQTTGLKLDPAANPDHFETGESTPSAEPEETAAEPKSEAKKVRPPAGKWRASSEPFPD